RAPAVVLAGMAVRPPLSERPSRGRIWTRRLVAFGVLAVVVVAAVAIAPATTAPPPPKPLRIIFPEGFTVAQMAERITAVDRIAVRKRHVRPRLSERRYLRLTAKARF